MLKLSIVMPAYNEAATIQVTLKKVLDVVLAGDVSKEIVIVNDGSTDNSASIINEYSGK